MPTLLGLAGQEGQIPSTMDGRNLASCWTTKSSSSTSSSPAEDDEDCGSGASSVLVEYQSLGNVVRYNHTVDTYNHSFIALRLLQPHRDEDDEGSTIPDYWFYTFDFDGTSSSRAGNEQKPQQRFLLRNMKYIEYRDSRVDWNGTDSPLEQEMFDLERDPYELHNLIRHVSPLLIQALHLKLQRLGRCRGDSCRQEHSSGVMNKLTNEDTFAVLDVVEQ
jgi:hypothetical protein